MAADLEAEAGSDAALPLIEQLRAWQPAEADTILATLRLRQSRFDDAAAALESAFVRLREDPWPLLRFKQKALALSDALTRRYPGVSRRLFDALRQPFSLRALDEMRLVTLTDLSRQFDFVGACREPIGALEPHVPWTGDVPDRSTGLLPGHRRSAAGDRHPRSRRLFCARAVAARSAVELKAGRIQDPDP